MVGRSTRAQRDDILRAQIERAHAASFGLYDNALAETINGLYESEVIWRQRSWPTASAVEMATLRGVDLFNNRRVFGPIGHIPPGEAEADYYAAKQDLDMVA